MNLNFVPATRMPFSMEVSFLDTIQEIKQQIHEHHQIPAEKQTLIFNNRILQDDHTMYINYPEIIDNSHIQLIISENQDSTPPPPENQEPPPPPPSATTATPSTTSWEFGSTMENSELSDLWLIEKPRDNSAPPPPPPEIPTTATTKFYQESSLPTGMANPNTTFSDLGISLENKFPSLLQDMDLFDNSLNTAPPEMAPAMAMAMATPSKKITLILNMPAIGLTRMDMEFEVNDSILRLKEKIVNQVDHRIPVGKLVLRSYGVELHDQYTLLECGLFHHSEIDISFKRSAPPLPPPPPLPTGFLNATTNITNNNRKIPKVPKFPSSSSNPSKMDNNNGKNKNVMKPNIPENPMKLKIMVLPFHGKKKVAVEVNANDNVEELRKELDEVNEREPLNLSNEGFFFIHNQSVMDEDQSFEVQNVQEGDTIEIFNGTITKGSPNRKLRK